MRNEHISFIVDSQQAKELLASDNRIPSARKSSVSKWCKTASDEELAELATQCGYVEGTVANTNASTSEISIDVPENVETEEVEIFDDNGDLKATVTAYILPFKRTKTQKNPNGTFYKTFQFMLGNVTVRVESNLLRELHNKGELERGDTFRFKGFEQVAVPAKNGRKAYTFVRGIIMEYGDERLEDTRNEQDEFASDLAGLTPAQQKEFLAKRDAKVVDNLLAKYGIA